MDLTARVILSGNCKQHILPGKCNETREAPTNFVGASLICPE
jgi:hypothetical protein